TCAIRSSHSSCFTSTASPIYSLHNRCCAAPTRAWKFRATLTSGRNSFLKTRSSRACTSSKKGFRTIRRIGGFRNARCGSLQTTHRRLGSASGFTSTITVLTIGVRWLRRLGVRYLRTGLSWSDTERSDYEPWFDRMMTALEPFDLTLTFCFTPESKGINPHHTSAPRHLEE